MMIWMMLLMGFPGPCILVGDTASHAILSYTPTFPCSKTILDSLLVGMGGQHPSQSHAKPSGVSFCRVGRVRRQQHWSTSCTWGCGRRSAQVQTCGGGVELEWKGARALVAERLELDY
ncbi:hypothetical protein CC79DRAFT_1164454 [Sarocladium strictum]